MREGQNSSNHAIGVKSVARKAHNNTTNPQHNMSKNKSLKNISSTKTKRSPKTKVVVPPSKFYAISRPLATKADLNPKEIEQLRKEEGKIYNNISILLSRHISQKHPDLEAIWDNINYYCECQIEFASLEGR
jgi:hypothetical protein